MAAPLLDLGGELYGLLLIEGMPFFSLQTENLQTINLLLGYYTDGLSMQTLAQPIVAALPDCPATFAFEAQRLSHIYASTQVRLHCAAGDLGAAKGLAVAGTGRHFCACVGARQRQPAGIAAARTQSGPCLISSSPWPP